MYAIYATVSSAQVTIEIGFISNAYCFRPGTANRKLSCSTEDIPRPVLLFVLNNLKTKKRFEKCCSPVAKAVIRCEKIDGSEKIEISLFANFLQDVSYLLHC